MQISISNLAWDTSEDSEILNILHNKNINAIDIAPGKYFPLPEIATSEEVRRVKNWWETRGVSIVGMQSLLFGTTGLNVFGSNDIRHKMLMHFTAIARIGGELGATKLVFGSPKNRDCSGLSDDQITDISADFFTRLGDIAREHGVIFCLEPNPVCYGANFMTSSIETLDVVKKIGHQSIKMQLDTGAIILNKEDILQVIEQSSSYIGHVHISEPQLMPVGDGMYPHEIFSSAITDLLPEHIATIEMLTTRDEPHIDSVTRAIDYVISHYR